VISSGAPPLSSMHVILETWEGSEKPGSMQQQYVRVGAGSGIVSLDLPLFA